MFFVRCGGYLLSDIGYSAAERRSSQLLRFAKPAVDRIMVRFPFDDPVFPDADRVSDAAAADGDFAAGCPVRVFLGRKSSDLRRGKPKKPQVGAVFRTFRLSSRIPLVRLSDAIGPFVVNQCKPGPGLSDGMGIGFVHWPFLLCHHAGGPATAASGGIAGLCAPDR